MDVVMFKAQLAEEHGIDVAVMLHNMVYWTEKNIANDRNYRNGRYWTYNSMAALAELYPFWSKDQIKRILAKCKDAGLLLVDDFNPDRKDRTKWYSPSDGVLALYGIAGNSKWRNRQMHVAESPDACGEIASPIPDSNQDNIPPIAPQGGKRAKKSKTAPDWKPDRFSGFWDYYPRHESKQAAIRAWDKLKPSDDLIAIIARALERAKQSEEWQRGIGIPYASTWLNQERWTDEAPSPKLQPTAAETGWAEDPEVL